ncbi:MAG: type I-E CRISPR-associated protein Cas7/Cse4/CasC [Methanoculleaceae archaeon]
MTEFIQLHMLASYPPANLNRDDLGRPKTAIMGGTQRLRVSSQSLKRAWRESEFFQEGLAGHMGIRTREMGSRVVTALTTGKTLKDVIDRNDAAPVRSPVDEKTARKWAKAIADVFGKTKKDSVNLEQLVHFSIDEIQAIDDLLERCVANNQDPQAEDLDLIRYNRSASDIAMFGRMLAASPAYNMEAAVQVAHALSVHEVVIEDDFFTAVDDLNTGEEDMGSAHMGEIEFASGLFYLYICINRDQLIENVGGDEDLANRSIAALTEAAAKIGPGGKQATFASRVYASYIRAERGTQQPRALSVAFLKPVKGDDMLTSAIDALTDTCEKMDRVYGRCYDDACTLNAHTGEGSLQDLIRFVGP